jgi:hypothetical protein
MPSNQQQALLECGCGCGGCTIGCCWPITMSNPLYPDGALDTIPFDLTGCSATLSGTFRPATPGTLDSGICGPCGSYWGDFAGFVVGVLKIDTGVACMDTPCTVTVCLALECVIPDDDSLGLEQCCSNIRLWIGTSEPMVGSIGEEPPLEIQVGGCGHWKKIAPSTCTCDEVTGLSALFDISIALDLASYTSGPCAGQPTGCQIACTTLQLAI